MAAKLRPLLTATLVSITLYILNRIFFMLPGLESHEGYYYPIEIIYLFFWVCSLVILFIIIRVHQKSPDNTGFAYIAATLAQMAAAYVLLRPILAREDEGIANFEKINFFIIFILFLATETVITIRLLNNKQ